MIPLIEPKSNPLAYIQSLGITTLSPGTCENNASGD